MEQEVLEARLAELSKKLDRVIELLQLGASPRPARISKPRPIKAKPLPLTEEEIQLQQSRFQDLFTRWMNGLELEVQNELEAIDAEALRRFADANNLNITAKTPKTKALTLIAARFREKRQLLQGLSPRRSADA